MQPMQVYRATIDVCDKHGIWLDQGELDDMLDEQRRRQSVDSRKATATARLAGRVEGAVFDWVALFLPDGSDSRSAATRVRDEKAARARARRRRPRAGTK